MDFSDNINSIISDLYEGILDQQLQNKALHHLAQLLGSEHVALTTWNKRTNLTHIIQSSGLPEACTSAFQEHFYLLDPSRFLSKKFHQANGILIPFIWEKRPWAVVNSIKTL
jgi:hypothetical protein